MKLCIPIELKPEGGVNSFFAALFSFLADNGVPFTQRLDDEFDTLLINSWTISYSKVARLKKQRPNLRVIHRLDGAAQDYGRTDGVDRVQARVNLLADLTIFQSNYSKSAVTEKFKLISPRQYVVIPNCSNPSLFFPADADDRAKFSSEKIRVALVSWSTNHFKGTWRIDEIAPKCPNVQFILCGRFPTLKAHPNVETIGHLAGAELGKALRSCDLLLHLSLNDTCPNVIIEALACGLPVLYINSGGASELVGDCGSVIDLENPRRSIEDIFGCLPAMSRRARLRFENYFTPELIGSQYLEAMKMCSRQKRTSLPEILKLSYRGYPILPALPIYSLWRAIRNKTSRIIGLRT